MLDAYCKDLVVEVIECLERPLAGDSAWKFAVPVVSVRRLKYQGGHPRQCW